MSKSKISVICSLLVCVGANASVDYEKCAEFLTPNQETWSPHSAFGTGYVSKVPFTLEKDGSINPNTGIISYEKDKENNTEVIVHEIPDYYNVGYGAPDENGNFDIPKEKEKFVIKRNEQGHITSVTKSDMRSDKDLAEMRELQLSLYKRFTPEQTQKFHKSAKIDLNQVVPFKHKKSAELSFNIKDGKCVPSKLEEKNLLEPKNDGESIKTTKYDVKLCKDISKFFNDNPEAKGCFKSDLNGKMKNLFSKYIDHEDAVSAHFKTFQNGYGGGGGINYMHSSQSIESAIATSDVMNMGAEQSNKELHNKFQKVMRISAKTSPILTAHQLLQNCGQAGLDPILNDEDLWKEKKTSLGDHAICKDCTVDSAVTVE